MMHGWPVTHAVLWLYHTPSRVGGSASKKYSSSRGQDSNKTPSTKLGIGNAYRVQYSRISFDETYVSGFPLK